MQPKKPLVAIFLNPRGVEAIKLIPQKPFSDVGPMVIYQKIADLINEMNNRLKGNGK